MRGLVEHLRLAEKAAEDIYFAKVNRELIESLHRQQQAQAQRPPDSQAEQDDVEASQSAALRGNVRASQR